MNTQAKTRKMVQMALLAAIVVVLQLLSYTISAHLQVGLTLVLIPVVLGGALFGPKEGAILGGAFGAVVLICSIAGVDAGGSILWNVNPFLTAVVCIFKGAVAGFASALVYRALSKANDFVRTMAAAVVCPVVNTGLFCLCMVLFFTDTLSAWALADGTSVLTYIMVGLVGINFLIEFGLNLVLGPAIKTILTEIKK
ncbi:MAG: ECF transporter S component [Clostridiales bacterium]|nr:ECF transporter S component [Clostridiales bacterium]